MGPLTSARWEAGVDFYPIVAEALGGLGQDTVGLIQAIGTLIGQQSSNLVSPNPTSHLFHRFANRSVAGECVPLEPLATFSPSSSGQCHLTPMYNAYLISCCEYV